MNELINQLAEQATSQADTLDVADQRLYQVIRDREFAELIVDVCCLKLLDMHEKTNGQHNYYKHAALEVKRYLGT